uniref:Uncharacterized protein n=1 Tax=Physcomitrium patens TaxID=3218 RepID=A0A2K1K455_PHYPA|nr:hypothetical protein PHYPA_013029 [Physcomitrium patens]
MECKPDCSTAHHKSFSHGNSNTFPISAFYIKPVHTYTNPQCTCTAYYRSMAHNPFHNAKITFDTVNCVDRHCLRRPSPNACTQLPGGQ